MHLFGIKVNFFILPCESYNFKYYWNILERTRLFSLSEQKKKRDKNVNSRAINRMRMRESLRSHRLFLFNCRVCAKSDILQRIGYIIDRGKKHNPTLFQVLQDETLRYRISE